MDHLQDETSEPYLSHGDRASVNYPNCHEVATTVSHPQSCDQLLAENHQLRRDLQLLQADFHRTMQEHSRILNDLQHQQIQMNSIHSRPGANNVGAPASHNTVHLPGSAHILHSPHIPQSNVIPPPALGFRLDQYNLDFLRYYHQ